MKPFLASTTLAIAVATGASAQMSDTANGIIQGLDGKGGDMVSLSAPMSAIHGVLTANDAVPYVVAALSTADGPLVVEVPPATDTVNLFGTFNDV